MVTQKEAYAQEIKEELNKRIEEAKKSYDYYNQLYNKTGNPQEADSYDRARVEKQFLIDSLNEAKDYATGEYDKQDVLSFAYSKASALNQRDVDIVQSGRLRKMEEVKFEQQFKEKHGLTPAEFEEQTGIGAREFVSELDAGRNPLEKYSVKAAAPPTTKSFIEGLIQRPLNPVEQKLAEYNARIEERKLKLKRDTEMMDELARKQYAQKMGFEFKPKVMETEEYAIIKTPAERYQTTTKWDVPSKEIAYSKKTGLPVKELRIATPEQAYATQQESLRRENSFGSFFAGVSEELKSTGQLVSPIIKPSYSDYSMIGSSIATKKQIAEKSKSVINILIGKEEIPFDMSQKLRTESTASIGGIATSLFIGAGISKATKGLFLPKIISKEPLPISKIRTVQYIKPFNIGEETFEKSFIVSVSKTPARKAEQGTLAKSLLGGSTKQIIISPERIEGAISQVITKDGKIVEGTAIIKRKGKDVTLKKVYKLSGEAKEISSIKELTPLEKRMFYKGFGEKGIVSISEDASIIRSSVEQQKAFRVTGKPEKVITIIIPKAGKTITRQAGLGIVKEVPLKESTSLKGFISKSVSTDITMSNINRARKLTPSKEITFIKLPDTDTIKSSTEKLIVGTKKASKKSVELISKIKKSVENLLIKKGKEAASRIPQGIKSTFTAKEYPLIVGGYGAVSQYAGKGSYELGNFGGFNLKTIPLKKERLTFVSPEKTALIRKALVNLRAVEKQTAFEKQLFIPISNQIIQTKPMIREKEKLLELIATGQKQKQIEIQKQKVVSIPRNIIKNIAKTIFIPTRRIIIPSLPSENNISKKYVAIKDKLLGGIIPQVRRFGKWMDIGKPTTYKEAFRKAISYTKSTLGASFRLKKGEELLPLERLPSEFGLSKSSKFVGVQKIGKRLSAGSEVKEIMSFKNSEGRRKLLSI